MGLFSIGQVIKLRSDPTIKGAVVGVIEGSPETRYQVFTNTQGIQSYYASQIESDAVQVQLEYVNQNRFNAGLTASLIRNPTLSSLYSLNTAKIDFIPHQFRPVLKFIRSDRPRLLIADGVGVGKTIEAGLILKELEARRNLDSVLIICPRPLVSERKWETEMERFGENFTALDGTTFRYCIESMEIEGEWPQKYKKAIIPYSLFDEGNIFGTQKHKGLLEVEPPKFDLVIVDEAHHIRNTATYAYRAVSRFCDTAEAVVLLTATPVQLEYDDLYVLLNLLRPDLIIDKATFHDMAEPNTFINAAAAAIRGYQDGWKEKAYHYLNQACRTPWGMKVFTDNPSMTETLQLLQKDEISPDERVQMISDVESMHTFSNILSRTRRRDIGEFTLRKPHTVSVEFTPVQKELHDQILLVIHKMLAVIHNTENTKFMMTTIRRQTSSCLFGLVPMLRNILYRQLSEITDDDTDDVIGLNGTSDFDKFEKYIQNIISLAERLPEDDPKFDAMLEIVRNKNRQEKNKIMIFSSFRHTLSYLYRKLTDAGMRVAMIHGGVSDEDRRNIRKRFNPVETPSSNREAVDIVLFSEVGCEGLDYQFCDCMINYDLPWNPMKVEQRIGRIDRNGQTSESIAIYNMITPGTVDADIYDRCLMRIGVFQSSVGDCERILGELTTEINKIANDFTLSEAERKEKLQQATDNKIRSIKEQESFEEKQRDLFGVRAPNAAFDQELQNATNYWLSGAMLQNLVVCYLQQRLGTDTEYILGTKELRKLRLSQSARNTLLDDFKAAKYPRNEINKKWRKWLSSGEQILDFTFDSNCWKENPSAALLTFTHPLVRMAADYLQSKGKIVTTLEVQSDAVKPGAYPFAIYQWRFSGETEDLQIKTVASDDCINSALFELLKQSIPAESTGNYDSIDWNKVEDAHHAIWNQALTQHREKTNEIIRYKEASLRTSHAARMAILKEQVSKEADKRYIQMTQGKIRLAQDDFEQHISQLEAAKAKADILFELLAYGILNVIPQES